MGDPACHLVICEECDATAHRQDDQCPECSADLDDR